MTEQIHDDPFASIDAITPEDFLRAPAQVPVSPTVIRLAQRAWEGIPRKDGSITHVASHTFKEGEDEKTVRLLMRQLRASAGHVDPQCVITVSRDGQKVIWRASKRRNRTGVAQDAPVQ